MANSQVSQNFAQLGKSGNYVVTFRWTGDDANGTIPITAAMLQADVQGFRILSVETQPLTPAPTASYNIQLLDSFGADMMGGALTGLSNSSSQIFAASSATPAINGTFSLKITGNSAVSARGVVVVYFGPTSLINSNAGSPGPAGPAGPTGPTGPAGGGIVASSYTFTRTPGGSLSAGAPATVTVAPVPVGVNGSDLGHYIYITGGTGTAEAVLITGGTAVSGASTGTLSFTPLNNHTGAWTLTSASGGLQEALVSLPGGSGAVSLDSLNPSTCHAKVTFPSSGRCSINGEGALTLIRASDYPNGDLLFIGPGSAVNILNLIIENGVAGAQTSGAAIHWDQSSAITSGVSILNGYMGELLEAASICNQVGLGYFSINGSATPPVAAIKVIGKSSVPSTDLHFTGCALNVAAGSTNVVDLRGVDTITFTGCTFGRGTVQISMNPDSGYNVQGVYIDGCIFDTCDLNSIAMNIFNVTSQIANVRIANNLMIGESNPTTTVGIDVGNFSSTPNIFNVQINGNNITRFGTWGISVGATVANANIVISNNVISNNNTTNVAGDGGLQLISVNGLTVTGNTIGEGTTYNGIQLSASLTNAVITGNLLGHTTTPFFPNGATLSNVVLANNQGITSVVPAVASAASFPWPVNPTFTITGNTGITSLQFVPPAGSSGVLLTTSAAVAFTAGGTIGNTFTTTQNVPVNWFSDGTKVWLH